ncbi:Npun_F0296 family exosortase-dependent surface protein [Bradyrhizobium aeschynomenes]|uniref:Npun_F0296 family exosortase-dependent surface protein n=1 Tax=Bradyrhizobium aeschynomenes TaxID=2734909 RepID=UPI001556046F|nr:hypothetical protein [Bradyrhizobium aeschynomenes]
MNYAGKSDAALFSDGLGTSAPAYLKLDAPPAHAPADAIVVPDAHFLFNADFKRSGLDLVLSSDGRELVLPDYFKGEKRAPLASPDGAHLTGDLVNALSGAVQVSQAGGTASAGKVIGHVTKLQGTATVIRNGVSILLHNGDNVEKGDIVQSGSNSTVGITFIDGTVFGLSSNARMVLNEMVYDPNGSNNSSLISLVAGTISFVAGETAKHGDMKVDTPVATMGIRGTAVLVEIDFTVPGQGGLPDAKFQVLVEPDGRTGSYVLYDKTTLQPIAVVNQAGQQIQISNGIVNQSAVPLSPDIQKLINDVFTLKFTDNTNPKSTTHFTDIGVPQALTPVTLANGTSATPIVRVVDDAGPTTGTGQTGEQPLHIPGPPEVRIFDADGRLTAAFGLIERAGQTGNGSDLDTVLSRVSFLDVNGIDRPTVSVSFNAYSYKSAQQTDVTGSLNALQLQDVMATAVKITVTPNPNNKNSGTATLTYSVPDKYFDFLAAGETLTLTYIVRVDNNFAPSNEFTLVPVTITVTGTNDKPEITASVPTIAFEGGTNVPGGPLTSDDPTAGTLTFKDVDLTDTHTVSATLTSAVLEGGGSIPPAPLALFAQALTASISSDSTGSGAGTISWSLGNLPVYVADFIPAGQTVTLTYTVTLTDSQGATSTQTITVTITGTDDPAVVWIATTQAGGSSGAQVHLWSDGANWATGLAPTADDDVIIITDQLHGLTPAFPVTIDEDVLAYAKSVTLNDFGGGAVPELDNHGTLTVSGALTAKVDSLIYNFSAATITVGGSVQILGQSELHNAGTVLLAGGGMFGGDAGIFNTGTIELSGGTLTVQGDVTNVGEDSSGLIQVDLGATLTLDGGSIDGGTILIQGAPVVQNFGTLNEGGDTPTPVNGLLVMKDGAELSNGELTNFGTIEVSGSGNAFSNETITNVGLIDVKAGGELALGNETIIDNAVGAIVTIAESATLTLSHAEMTGGTLTNEAGGTIALTGGAALIGGALDNSGIIAVSGSGNAFDDETITNANAAAITIALGGALSLSGTSIAGGAVTSEGTISVDGDSTIDGSAVAGGTLLVGEIGPLAEMTAVLTVEGGASLTGVDITIGDGSTLEVAADETATLVGVTVDNSGTVQVDDDALLLIENSTIAGGNLVNHGTVHVETAAATTFDNVTIDNTDGVIIIDEDGEIPVESTLVLDGNTALTGGTLEIRSVGTLQIVGNDVTLSDMDVQNFGIFTVDPGATLGLADTKVSSDGTLYIYGTITASGLSGIGGTIFNFGTIEITAGTFEITGDVEGSGLIKVDADATLTVDGHIHQTIDFSSEGNSEIVIDDASFSAKLAGLGTGDRIDLQTIKWGEATTASYDAETGVLTVVDGEGHSIALTLEGDFSDLHFAGSDDGQGGTLITLKADDTAPVVADAGRPGAITEAAAQTGASDQHSVTGSVKFTDADLTDRPTASIGAQSVTWLAADQQTDLSGQLTPDQIAALEQALKLSQVGNANNGKIDWTYAIADDTLDFLGAGQTVTVTSTVTIDDHQGHTAMSAVVVTINGTNDLPVVTSEVQSAEIAERTDTSGSDLLDQANGTITFGDADITDAHVLKVTGVATSGNDSGLPADASVLESWLSLGTLTDTGTGGASQAWTFAAKDKAFDYLGVGEHVTLTYTIEIDDGHGGLVEVPVTVTVTGAEDAPVITGETNPTVQTVVLSERATVLASTAKTNAEGMPTETFDHVSAGNISDNGRGHGSFHSEALHATFTASGNAGIVHGSSPVSAAPYMADGADKTNYLSIGSHAQETITFDSVKNSFGLYWGSVDSYNSISFYNGNKLVASYTGNDVAPLLANGGQGSLASNGYVEFLGLSPFNKVVLASSQNAFEIDNISAGNVADQPVQLASKMSGTLTVLDKDVGDTLTAAVIDDGVIKYNGLPSLPANAHVQALADAHAITFDSTTSDGKPDVLHWTYHPADVNLDFLNPGDTLTVTYQARVSDGHGGTATKALTVTLAGNGASTVNGTDQDDNFVNVGGGVTIFGKDGNDTFVFNPHFGSATIGDFDLSRDVVEFDQSLFAKPEALLASAQSANNGHDTVITDAAHDTLTLKGVTLDQFKLHHDGFHLV